MTLVWYGFSRTPLDGAVVLRTAARWFSGQGLAEFEFWGSLGMEGGGAVQSVGGRFVTMPGEDLFEAALAVGAGWDFGDWDGFFGDGGLPGEELSDLGSPFVGGGAEPAVVADTLEAAGQGVLEEAANELVAGESEGFLLAAFAADVGDGDVASVVREDAFGAEGALADVAGEVAYGGVSFADVADVGVPAEPPDFGCNGFVEDGVGLAHGPLHEGAHAGGEGFDWEEVFGVFWALPFAFGAEAAEGDEVVDVGVVFELAGPGVEDAEQAEGGSKVALVAGEVLEGLGAAMKEEAVAEFLVGAEGAAEFGGDGEGDEGVSDGEEFALLFFGPELGVLVTALGAEAVVAAVVGEVGFAAVAAAVDGAAHRGGCGSRGWPAQPCGGCAGFCTRGYASRPASDWRSIVGSRHSRSKYEVFLSLWAVGLLVVLGR